MRSDWVISGAVHAVLLLLVVVSLASSKPREDPADYVPVSVVTDADKSRAAIGQLNLPKPDKPKPLADKVDALKQVDQLAPKVVNKPEITTSSTVPEPKLPPKPQQQAEQSARQSVQNEAAAKPQRSAPDQARPQPQQDARQGSQARQKPRQQPKPDAKPNTKPDAKTAQKPAPFKPDRIANLLKQTHAAQPRQKPTPNTPKYNANQIAQLLDHRAPQRRAATAASLNSSASLGAPDAPADAQLSQNEIDALRERLRECWSPPPGVNGNMNIYVSLRVLFKPNGALAQPPVIVAGSPSPLGPALAESGKRALLLCQPFTMLKPEHYAQWRDMTVDFDPRDLAGN